MNFNGLVALANAGFSREEIINLAKIEQTAPTPAPAQPVVQPPMTPPMDAGMRPFMSASATQAPTSYAIPPVPPMVQPFAPAVTQDQVYQSFLAGLKNEMKELKDTVHQAAINTAQQPPQVTETPEEVLAKILDPHPPTDKEV